MTQKVFSKNVVFQNVLVWIAVVHIFFFMGTQIVILVILHRSSTTINAVTTVPDWT